MDIGVEHLFDLVFHLAADEDEAAGRNVVVCGFDEDGVAEPDRAWRTGKGVSSQKLGLGGVAYGRGKEVEKRARTGRRGGDDAGRLLKVKVILDMNPMLVLVLVAVLEPVLESFRFG